MTPAGARVKKISRSTEIITIWETMRENVARNLVEVVDKLHCNMKVTSIIPLKYLPNISRKMLLYSVYHARNNYFWPFIRLNADENIINVL